jgi:hypothetical protein
MLVDGYFRYPAVAVSLPLMAYFEILIRWATQVADVLQ